MAKTDTITQERLKELLHYDPVTGLFTWLISRGRVSVGSVAGCKALLKKPDGFYILNAIDCVSHLAHRLAFLYMTSSIPDLIDHWDTDGTNNIWRNLRECTQSQNNANSRSQLRHKIGGNVKGWSWDRDKGKFRAFIKIDGKAKHLGYFDEHTDAAEAYAKAAKEYYGEFARLA